MTRRERATEVLQEIRELFDDPGKLQEGIFEATLSKLTAARPCDSWSLGNRIAVWMAGTRDARGFKQWQQVGRTVRKGEKAFYILGPATRKVDDEDSGEPKVIVTGFVAIPVFALESTEGDELGNGFEPPELPPLQDAAERLGLTVDYIPAGLEDRCFGYYRPGSDRIVLHSHDASVWFHELAHAAHKRALGGEMPDDYSHGEIVAETCAAVLCRLYGLELANGQASREYVTHWANGHAGKAAMAALRDIEQTLDVLLTDVKGCENAPIL